MAKSTLDHRGLSEYERIAVEMAGIGCISGTLNEWPFLLVALRKLGYEVTRDTTSTEAKKICRKLIGLDKW